jgi:hypothetical protein
MPRLDYSNGSCPSLLLEPSRTNLVTNSEYFDSWGKIGSPLLTTNYGTSPEGLQNSTRIQGVNGDRIFIGLSEVSNTYTYSIYAKGSGDIILRDNTGSNFLGISLTADWKRYDYSFTEAVSNIQVQFESTTDVEIWGAQFEQGSYPTSYIPTYGVSQTRLQELGRVGDYIDTTITFGPTDDFSIFYDGERFELDRMIIGGGNSGLNAGRLWIRPTQIRLDGTTPSASKMAETNVVVNLNTRFKLLVKRNGATIDFFLDGSKLTTTQFDTDASFVINSLFWSFSNSYIAFGRHKQLLVFDTALSDEACIELTTIS